MERLLKEKDAHIEQLLEHINHMKRCFHAWVERSDNSLNELENLEQTHVAKIPIKVDESYFMTYAHFDIHYDMLSVSLHME